jgi:hypothetical protein
MGAREAVSKLVTTTIAPPLKSAGFRKQALTFERKRGEVTQIVNVQVSHGGVVFYVNVGFIFDAVSALGANQPGSEVIGKYTVHHGARLEQLVPGLPQSWDPGEATTGERIRGALEELMPLLDRIDGARAMLDAVALDRGFEKQLRAQLKWCVGDRAGARADLEALVAELAERGLKLEKIAKRIGLGGLLEA